MGVYDIVVVEDDVHTLKDPVTSYMVHLGYKKQTLSDDNTIKLEQNLLLSNDYVGSTPMANPNGRPMALTSYLISQVLTPLCESSKYFGLKAVSKYT